MPALPLVYNLNHVELTVPVEPAAALELVDRSMAEAPFRHLIVADEPSGERLAEELRPAGWKIERNVLMAFGGELDRSLDTSAVIEVSEEEALGPMGEWVATDEECGNSPEMYRQVMEAIRLIWRARGARHFGVRGRDGALAGITMLFSDGSVAEVEDVYVTAKERGRGLGRALVTHAVGQALDAGHELVFIPADDDNWPKDLYASVGFERVARLWIFNRWVGG